MREQYDTLVADLTAKYKKCIRDYVDKIKETGKVNRDELLAMNDAGNEILSQLDGIVMLGLMCGYYPSREPTEDNVDEIVEALVSF